MEYRINTGHARLDEIASPFDAVEERLKESGVYPIRTAPEEQSTEDLDSRFVFPYESDRETSSYDCITTTEPRKIPEIR